MTEVTVTLSVVLVSNVRKERVYIFSTNVISVEHFSQMLVKSIDAEPTNPFHCGIICLMSSSSMIAKDP